MNAAKECLLEKQEHLTRDIRDTKNMLVSAKARVNKTSEMLIKLQKELDEIVEAINGFKD